MDPKTKRDIKGILILIVFFTLMALKEKFFGPS